MNQIINDYNLCSFKTIKLKDNQEIEFLIPLFQNQYLYQEIYQLILHLYNMMRIKNISLKHQNFLLVLQLINQFKKHSFSNQFK